MTRRQRRIVLLLAAFLAAAVVVGVEVASPSLAHWGAVSADVRALRSRAPIRVTRPGLGARAAIPGPRAWEIAGPTVPGTDPAYGTLTELGGRLVYVLAFERDGRSAGEVIVDATTGEVLSGGGAPSP